MVWMIERAHTLAEGAGAASLAAAYRLRGELAGKKVGVVCSGGNTSLAQLRLALARGEDREFPLIPPAPFSHAAGDALTPRPPLPRCGRGGEF